MKKLCLTLFIILFSFAISISTFAATDSTIINPSYDSNNSKDKYNRTFDNNFYDPNHVTDDRNNILNNNNNNNMLRNTENRVNNNSYYQRTGTPTQVNTPANVINDDVHMNYGWLGWLLLAGLIGLAAYFIFRKRESVE